MGKICSLGQPRTEDPSLPDRPYSGDPDKKGPRIPGVLDPALDVKPQKCVSGGSEESWFFMSQHRENSARGKVIDKK